MAKTGTLRPHDGIPHDTTSMADIPDKDDPNEDDEVDEDEAEDEDMVTPVCVANNHNQLKVKIQPTCPHLLKHTQSNHQNKGETKRNNNIVVPSKDDGGEDASTSTNSPCWLIRLGMVKISKK